MGFAGQQRVFNIIFFLCLIQDLSCCGHLFLMGSHLSLQMHLCAVRQWSRSRHHKQVSLLLTRHHGIYQTPHLVIYHSQFYNFCLSRSRSYDHSYTSDHSPVLWPSACLNHTPYRLLQSAKHYMKQGLAPSTLKPYDFVWGLFASFCLSINVPLLPILISTVCAFICYCKDARKLKLPYIRSLIVGIQYWIPNFVFRCISQIVIKLVSNPISDNRKPITLSALQKMLHTPGNLPIHPSLLAPPGSRSTTTSV